GGLFLASDWLRGSSGPQSALMQAWMKSAELSFRMATPEETTAAMTAAGFEAVEVRDRADWFRQQCRRDLATVEGPAREALIATQGAAGAETLIERTRMRIGLADSRELLPCHLKGERPA
ncbi:MAG: hypothetical protein MI785_01675, partial [Kiloniellales bacterium]|nr:hypothetical protein [Kiloniellales bacterium]